MQVLFAVIDELYSFAIDSVLRLFGKRSPKRGSASENRAPARFDFAGTGAEMQDIETEQTIPENEPLRETATFRSAAEILSPLNAKRTDHGGEKNTIMYVGSTEVAVYKNPTKEFDSKLGTLVYGEMVMVLGEEGKWVSIVYQDGVGWVHREDLVDRAAYVYPAFVVGEANNADDPNTLRVRAILSDMFGGGDIEMPLQAPEYVEYRLRRKGIRIAWPNERPRLPGLWHKILKGIPGVHMNVMPKTGSVMEYMLDEDTGHTAYIEAVFPDETIKITEANYPDGGIYNERVLTREKWKELKPIFIHVI